MPPVTYEELMTLGTLGDHADMAPGDDAQGHDQLLVCPKLKLHDRKRTTFPDAEKKPRDAPHGSLPGSKPCYLNLDALKRCQCGRDRIAT